MTILILWLPGCGGRSGGVKDSEKGRRKPEVVVFTALDREFSEPVLKDFAATSSIRVLPKYDIESIKTLNLVNEIIAQKRRPSCDVFWNNELLHTLRLKQMGLLDVYVSPAAADYPAEFRSTTGHWHGFAARARVLIVNTDKVTPEQRPTRLSDLLDTKWKGQCGIARPLFGTTATHAAVLFHHWGEPKARKFFRDLKSNARVLSGNKQVARDVAEGRLAFGLTDTDDAIIEKENGFPVAIVFPDQEEGGLGTLLIPNSLAIIKGGPNPTEARKLIDYLLRPEVEERLAAGESAQFPVNPAVQARSRVEPQQKLRWMKVDFDQVVGAWDAAAKFLREQF